MSNFFERHMTNSVYRLYPERAWIPYAASFGNRLRVRLGKYRFDRTLLDVQYPSIGQLIRSSYAYARYETFFTLEVKAKAWGKALFEDCYFRNRNDAEGFFYLTFYPRYLLQVIMLTMRGCGRFIRLASTGDKTPLQSTQLCLAAFYSDQQGLVTP
jgi:hypothetical protein